MSEAAANMSISKGLLADTYGKPSQEQPLAAAIRKRRLSLHKGELPGQGQPTQAEPDK